MLNVLISIFR